MNDIIHIALASDRNYLPYAAMTVAGVAKYTSRQVIVHFLYEEMHDRDFCTFDFLEKYPHVTLQRHQIKDAFFSGYPEMRWSRAIYYRLIIPDMFPELDKLIYLDCDLAVLDDVGKLYDVPLEDKLCMAVVTKISAGHSLKLQISQAEYFNSGVLVFSPAEWKRRNLIAEFQKSFVQYADVLKYPDQDILNVVFKGAVKILHPRWNIITSTYRNEPVECYSVEEVIEALQSPGIVHYTGSHKPWVIHKTFHHPYSLALKSLAEISGQKKIAAILRLKSLFLPAIAKLRKKLPWDKQSINTELWK